MVARRAPAQSADLAVLLIALLEAIGVDDLLTTTEAAEAAGITAEAIRCWCRDGKVGFYDPRLRQFLIPRRELRAFLEAHWCGRVPARFDDFVPAQTRSALSIVTMTTAKPPPRLTAMEKQQLENLLHRVEGFRAGPVADALREEQRLKAKQEKLAARERKLAAKVAELRADLDEIAERLGAMAARRSPAYSLAPKLKPLIQKWAELERPKLAAFVEDGLITSKADLERDLEKFLTVFLTIGRGLDTTAARFLSERPSDAPSLADHLEAYQQANGSAPPPKTDAEKLADQVMALGRRWNTGVFVPEPESEPPNNKRRRR
jgi:excisionase family DNA binding protein